MSASWPLSPSVRASVNGTSNTVGNVRAASFAANVGPVHWYSIGFTSMLGLAFSNCATCWSNCAFAASVLPGMSETTLIVTFFASRCADAALADTVSRAATASATIMVLRVDFIVLPLSLTLLRLIRLADPDGGVLRNGTSFDVAAGD
jgi:hypothetical protein